MHPEMPARLHQRKKHIGNETIFQSLEYRTCERCRERFERRQRRLEEEKNSLNRVSASKPAGEECALKTEDKKSEIIRKALERARAKAREYSHKN